MRGVVTTTKPSNHYHAEQSLLIKRHATQFDLEQAQATYLGKIVQLTPQSEHQSSPPYRCKNVRIDSLKRLILDLIKDDGASPGEREKE